MGTQTFDYLGQKPSVQLAGKYWIFCLCLNINYSGYKAETKRIEKGMLERHFTLYLCFDEF